MSITKASRDVLVTEARIRELEKHARLAKVVVALAFVLAVSGVVSAVLVNIALLWLLLVAAVGVVLGCSMWIHVYSRPGPDRQSNMEKAKQDWFTAQDAYELELEK